MWSVMQHILGKKDSYKELRDINVTWWPNLNLNYWGITKCGNTKIRSHLFKLSTGVEYEISTAFEKENLSFIYRKKAFKNKCRNFTVTRHPLLRFFSAWKDLCKTRPRRGVKAGLDPSWSPLELAQWVEHMPDAAVDIHFKSQHWFVPKQLDVEIDLQSIQKNWPFDVAAPTSESVRPSTQIPFEIDDATAQIVMRRYQTDYERFGYSEELPGV